MHSSRIALAALLMFAATNRARGAEAPLPQAWDYTAAMKAVAARFKGREGVVVHIGDSITYANPYGAWARYGAGKTADDEAALRWMHAGADNDTDGWWLARTDLPGGRSYTACSGIRADEMLAGGKSNMPPLEKLLDEYKPRMVVLMLGTNDVSAGRKLEDYRQDMTKSIDLMLARGIIPILSTIPPHVGRPELSKAFNEALRALTKAKSLPLIDFEAEILERRPTDWDGTLLGKGDVHPTANQGSATPASEPTTENLSNSGYLLRGWLSVKKIGEVKLVVLDGKPLPLAPGAKPGKTSPAPAPAEETFKLPVTRDTYFSNVGAEIDGNMGGAAKLKVKSIQEMTLIDVDTKPLVGRVIKSATLHAHGKDLKRVTVSSFASDWVEGTSTGYQPQTGSSSFRWAQDPDVPWTKAGGDLCAVMLGQGGTLWRMADAEPADSGGWQQVPIDPAVLAARVAGISYGLLVFDDTGTEWTRDGERFSLQLFPNRFFAGRESGADTAPYLTVTLGEVDRQPPGTPTDFQTDTKDLPAGETRVSWITPEDAGPAGTVGFVIKVNGKKVPRDMIPAAGKPGERVTMHLRDLNLAPDAESIRVAQDDAVRAAEAEAARSGNKKRLDAKAMRELIRKAATAASLTMTAVDAAGNIGLGTHSWVPVSTTQPQKLSGVTIPFTAPADAQRTDLPRLGDCQVAILDPLDKVQPVTGEMIPPQPKGYLVVNQQWNARRREIRLTGAKNEFVGFQILLRGKTSGVRPRLEFSGNAATSTPQVTFGRYVHVQSTKGPLPDPVVPLDGPLAVPTPDEQIDGQQSGSLLCEVYIPHDALPGQQTAKLRLESTDGVLEIPVQLTVWDFTLPDHLSFLPEMNCYDLPENERSYYRLAQLHRTVLNRVPYHQSGAVEEGCAPKWDGHELDWSAWDKRFGPLLDGSAFADLPRGPVPVECFYLPIQENWPSPMAGNYNGSYWADEAFPTAYRQALVEVSRQMALHFDGRAWRETLFQFFLNGKNNFKTAGWSRGSSPWLLDEPANFQDYWALRWFGQAFHEGVKLAGGQAKLVFRADISRPQWQRDALDGVLDYNVVGGGAFRQYHRLVLDRRHDFGQIVVDYGSSNAIEQSNMQPVGWALDSWSLESDGILPWQTIGNAAAWKKANAESLFYPPRSAGGDPIPSIRLKAYRRGQQDVEYLTLLARQSGEPRWAVGQRTRETLHLAGRREGTGVAAGEDAGVITFADLLPQHAAALRERLGGVLSGARPRAEARLVEFRTPPRDGTHPSPGHMADAEIKLPVERATAEHAVADAAAGVAPAGAIVLQGRGVVRDALVDFAVPDQALGAEPRSNALRRADRGNAFLLRFDLAPFRASAVKPPPAARLRRATVGFYVWDPSSQGNTKVVAARLKAPWDEAAANWRRRTAKQNWQAGDFDPAADTTDVSPAIVVKPEQGSDTADPPLEYQIDVTRIVKAWLDGSAPNEGLAILPVADRPTDDGLHSRFQIYASEFNNPKVTPKLVLEFEP